MISKFFYFLSMSLTYYDIHKVPKKVFSSTLNHFINGLKQLNEFTSKELDSEANLEKEYDLLKITLDYNAIFKAPKVIIKIKEEKIKKEQEEEKENLDNEQGNENFEEFNLFDWILFFEQLATYVQNNKSFILEDFLEACKDQINPLIRNVISNFDKIDNIYIKNIKDHIIIKDLHIQFNPEISNKNIKFDQSLENISFKFSNWKFIVKKSFNPKSLLNNLTINFLYIFLLFLFSFLILIIFLLHRSLCIFLQI